jgi:hypothetical protein
MVPNAKVTAQSSLIGVTRTVTSAQSGDFVIPNLPPSTYTLVVEAQGSKSFSRPDLS